MQDDASVRLSRRALLHGVIAVGGALVTASLLSGCQPTPITPGTPTPTPKPPASPTPMSPIPQPQPTAIGQVTGSPVAIVKTTNREDGVRRALALLAINPVKGKNVILKANYNSADPTPGSTHPETLRALLRLLWEMGARSVTLLERSGMGATRRVLEERQVFAIGKDLGMDIIVLDELERQEWEHVTPHDSHWSMGFAMPARLMAAEAVVQTCCLKTHRFGGHFTLSLKNSVGLAARTVPGEGHDYMAELHASPSQRVMIAELNTAYSPALIVLDGLDAFVTGGPDRGQVERPSVMIAGTDRVAVDAVGVAILRHLGTTPEVRQGRIWQQQQIARAVDLGLGAKEPGKVVLLADDTESIRFAQTIRDVLDKG